MRVPSNHESATSADPTQKTDVEKVADNISQVVDVSNNMVHVVNVDDNEANINAVSQDLPDINAVAAIEQSVDALANNLTNIDAVAAELAAVLHIDQNLATLLVLHQHMAKLLDIHGSLDNIDAVAANESNINSVYESIPEITTVVSHMEDIHYLAANADSLNEIFNNLDALVTLENNLDVVNNLNENMDIIIDASTYVDEIEVNLAKVEASEANVIALEAQAATSAANASVSEANAASSESASSLNAAEAENQRVLADVAASASQTYADASQTSADASAQSATQSATSASNAAGSKDLAEDFMETARDHKDAAAVSAGNALTSETNAGTSEAAALVSEQAAKTSEDNAKTSETNASNSESAALASEQNAKASELAAAASEANASTSETNSAASATAAANSASASEDSAVRAEAAAVSAQSALSPKGDWNATTGNFPTPTLAPERADFYQISGTGTMSDSNPAQPDVSVNVGDQLYWHMDKDIWYKIDNTDQVTSVDGKKGAVVVDKYTQAEVDSITNPIATRANDTYTKAESDAKEFTIYANIDTKSDTGHTHTEADITDLDKYTKAEVDGIATTLRQEADARTHVEADITDLDKYTQAETNTLLDAKVSIVDGAVDMPKGTVATRPDTSGANNAKALFWFNTETGEYEAWNPVEQEWGAVGGGGSVGEFVTTTTNTTMVDGDAVLFDAENATGDLTLTLPIDVKAGRSVTVGFKGEASHTLWLYSANDNIMGGSQAYDIKADNFVGTLNYIDEATGWKWVHAIGESEAPNAIKTETKGTYPVGTDTFPIAYDVGFVEVFVNGLQLAKTSYNAGTGTEVILNTPLMVESVVLVRAWNHVTVDEVTAGMVTSTDGTVQGDIDELKGDVQANADAVTRIDGEVEVLQQGNAWVIPTLLNGVYRSNDDVGLKWRYVDANTIQVIGTAWHADFPNGVTTCFNFPAEVANRIDVELYAPAMGSTSVASDTYSRVRSSGEFSVVGYSVGDWFMVNHTIPLN